MGGIHESGFTSLGRGKLPWLGVTVNEIMIRNFSFTLDDIVESIVKTMAAQQGLLDTLTKVISDNRIIALN